MKKAPFNSLSASEYLCYYVLYILSIALLFHAPAAYSEVVDDKYHPHCLEAYQNLPIDFKTGFGLETDSQGLVQIVDNDAAALQAHFRKHQREYLQYDKDCFFTWDDLHANTKEFLSSSSGVLFHEYALDEIQPYCSAIRISKDKILTASHCVEPLMTFRLFGDPRRSLKVDLPTDADAAGVPNSDLDDYVILNVEESPKPFNLLRSDFSRESLDHQFVAIVSISMAVYEAKRLVPDDWLEAVRFTRLDSSQLFSFAQAAGKNGSWDDALNSECLLHMVQTFAGMSGAPILAVRRPQVPTSSPKLYVVGIHLRNGAPESVCGDWPRFNVGIRVPKSVLGLIREGF